MYKTLREINGDLWDLFVSEKPLEHFSYLSQKEKYDYCIKLQLLSGDNYLPGIKLKNNNETNFGFYISRYKKYYDRYLSKNLYLEKILSPEIKEQYEKGEGNEFHSGKFYSVASSSRFAVSCFSELTTKGIIESLKKLPINGKIENVNISFEEGLTIDGIPNNATLPQMDVIIKTDSNDTYFVEVKCHEILDSHKTIKLRSKYLAAESFDLLIPQRNNISIKTVIENNKVIEYISKNNNYLTAKDFNCNLSTTHFDFKQFLCHTMGILSYKNKNRIEKLHFYYLFYRNEEYLKLTNGNKQLYTELEAEMSEIFNKFREKIKDIDFGFCYNSKFDTLSSLKKENT